MSSGVIRSKESREGTGGGGAGGLVGGTAGAAERGLGGGCLAWEWVSVVYPPGGREWRFACESEGLT